MKREVGLISATFALALLAGTGLAQAQETRQAPPRDAVVIQGADVAVGQEGPGPVVIQGGVVGEGEGFFAEHIQVLGFGGLHGGKVVKGAPFSAAVVSETTQTLADGNHITRKTQTNLYRDSQGRIRKEVSLPAIGPLAASGQPHSFVEINDPVAGTAYVLEPDQKIARQMPGGGMGMGMKVRTAGGPGDVLYRTFKDQGKVATTEATANVKSESLGTQTINGVNVEGTRTTRTIAAGEIGNEQPITVVSERWYSADLQMVVKSTHSDPRFGNTTYTLTNIQRTEPAASLFAVPSDYTIEQGHRGRFQVNVPPPPAPPED